MPFKHLSWPHSELGSGGDAALEQIADPYNCRPRSCLRDIQTVRLVFRAICLTWLYSLKRRNMEIKVHRKSCCFFNVEENEWLDAGVLVSLLLLFLWGWEAFCWHLFILGAGWEARLETNGLLGICFSNSSSHKRLTWLVHLPDQPLAYSQAWHRLSSSCQEWPEEWMHQGKNKNIAPAHLGRTPPSASRSPWMSGTSPALDTQKRNSSFLRKCSSRPRVVCVWGGGRQTNNRVNALVQGWHTGTHPAPGIMVVKESESVD